MSRTTRRDESIGSVEELLAVADALEREAVTRYRGLSTRMSRQGEAAMAAQFDTLAALEERHVDKIADRAQGLLGRPPAALRAGWELPTNYGEDEARGAELSAYQALAFAVRNEERAFAFYVYVAAAAKDSAARALAEDLARDELEHASNSAPPSAPHVSCRAARPGRDPPHPRSTARRRATLGVRGRSGACSACQCSGRGRRKRRWGDFQAARRGRAASGSGRKNRSCSPTAA